VTGTVILIIGLSLMRVAAGWIVDGSTEGAPPINVAFAFCTLLLIVLIHRAEGETVGPRHQGDTASRIRKATESAHSRRAGFAHPGTCQRPTRSGGSA
jgi:hypothetical protein